LEFEIYRPEGVVVWSFDRIDSYSGIAFRFENDIFTSHYVHEKDRPDHIPLATLNLPLAVSATLEFSQRMEKTNS